MKSSYTLELGTNGRLTLPAALRKQFDYSEGDLFVLRVQGEGKFELLAGKDVALNTRGLLKTLKPKSVVSVRSVLTASAFLDYLDDGPKAQVVQEALRQGCVMSALAWHQVLLAVAKQGVKPEVLIKALEQQSLLHHSLEIVPFTFEDACAMSLHKFDKNLETVVLAERLKLLMTD